MLLNFLKSMRLRFSPLLLVSMATCCVAASAQGDDSADARIISGINWSPTIKGNDPFKDLGKDNNLRGLLSNQRIESDSPIVLVAHVVLPRAQFFDRGKGRCDLD